MSAHDEFDVFNKSAPLPPPPGLVGEIAEFIYAYAYRQVAEIALAGALAFFAAIVGRAYNTSRTGLNVYIFMLARTGAGKDAIKSGINKLVRALTAELEDGRILAPTAANIIGPADMSSGQALVRALGEPNWSSCVTIWGEGGIRMAAMADSKAPDHQKSLLRVLLDAFMYSGQGQVLGGSVYANKANDTKPALSPAFSLIGEGTPATFYSNVDEDMVRSGLLPRFAIIEYDGPRPPPNKNAESVEPSFDMLERISKLIGKTNSLNEKNNVVTVEYAIDAKWFLDRFETYADAKINASGSDAVAELWNRAHLKALKFAALIAVGCNIEKPRVSIEIAQWATAQVSRDIHKLMARFESGQYGAGSAATDHDRQAEYVLKKVVRWSTCKFAELPKDFRSSEGLHAARFVPFRFLSNQCLSTAAFKVPNPTAELKRTIQTLIDEERIERVEPDALTPFNIRQECYRLTDASAIDV